MTLSSVLSPHAYASSDILPFIIANMKPSTTSMSVPMKSSTSKSSSEYVAERPRSRRGSFSYVASVDEVLSRPVSPTTVDESKSGFSDAIRATSWTRHLKGTEPALLEQNESSSHANADLVTHDTARLTLHYNERIKGDKENSRRFEPIIFDPEGTLDGRSGGMKDLTPKTARMPPPVKYSSRNGRPREETFHAEHKDLTGLERYFFEHRFGDYDDDEMNDLQEKRFNQRELAAGLVYAVGMTQALLGDYKDALVDAGDESIKTVHQTTLSKLNFIIDTTVLQEILPLDELDVASLARRPADKKNLPTVAVLGEIKERLLTYIGMYARRKELRFWIDHTDRQRVGGEPTKLHQSKFTQQDLNYAAWYARLQRNTALNSYTDLYKLCEEYKMIDRTVKVTGCPSPEKILDLEAKHEDFVDFNVFKETELLYYDWPPIDLPHVWRGKKLVTDPFGDPKEASTQKNWRFSIALWAHNADMLRRACNTLSLAYDEFWSLSSEDGDDHSMDHMFGDVPGLSARSSSP